jgi:hypothetical protein
VRSFVIGRVLGRILEIDRIDCMKIFLFLMKRRGQSGRAA